MKIPAHPKTPPSTPSANPAVTPVATPTVTPNVDPAHGRWFSFALQLLSVTAVIAWFLYLIRRAFHEYFNVDDMTNLVVPFLRGPADVAKSCLLFWTGAIRPLGGLFYVLIYQAAGFHHEPFRYAAIALLALNLVLLYFVVRRLNPDLGFAFLAVMLACYNGDLSDMYMSTGTVYDTLGLTFTLLALLCVMRERPRWLLAALCTIGAVDSKEMGAAIPAIVLAYELLIPTRPRWTAVISTGVVAFVFTLSRLVFPNALSNNPAYQLTLTPQRFLETTRVYLNDVAFHGSMSAGIAVAVLLLALALAAALRNRVMLFGWCYYVFALLPMSFATPRAGYAVYIPYAGVAIYFAALVFDRRWQRFAPLLAAAAVLAIVGYQFKQAKLLAKTQSDHPGGQGTVLLVAEGVAKLAPTLPQGARILLINDPFTDDEELPHSTLRLRYHDKTLSTTKLAWKKAPGKIPYPAGPFDRVFLFTAEKVTELPREAAEAAAPEYVTMKSPEADSSIVKDILGPDDTPNRWVNQDPELLFQVPKRPSHFEMTYYVPEVILKQTKTLEIEAWIAGTPAPPIHIAEANPYTYTAPIPPNAKPGDVVTVRLHIKTPYVDKKDGAKLSFLLTSAGFIAN